MQTEKQTNIVKLAGSEQLTLTDMEKDAIGEILNISMGASATAISSMLDKQVIITTPRVSVRKLKDISYSELEPAIIVSITYLEGITGANVMLFRQRDMELILNQLMGIDSGPSDDFVFDELSISAACEVMNQMMGASATALSDFLGKTINISTPEANLMDQEHTFVGSFSQDPEDSVVSVLFDITIEGIMQSEFMSVMSNDLVREIVTRFLYEETPTHTPILEPSADSVIYNQLAAQTASPQPEPPQPPQPPQMQPQPPVQGYPPQQPQGQSMYPGQPQGYPPQGEMPIYAPPGYPQGYPAGMPIYPQGMPMYPNGAMYNPYGYPMQPPHAQDKKQGVIKEPINVQNANLPDFSSQFGMFIPPATGNMDLIMNVPLNVSVEIGKTRRKIKEIMEFNQGTIIELEKQAGAPVDIIVNGQLIARGDVVVIDDNFGVRVTEILGMKDIMNSIENKE